MSPKPNNEKGKSQTVDAENSSLGTLITTGNWKTLFQKPHKSHLKHSGVLDFFGCLN